VESQTPGHHSLRIGQLRSIPRSTPARDLANPAPLGDVVLSLRHRIGVNM
jgi:hypothetical protein